MVVRDAVRRRRLGRRVGLKSPLDARGGRSCVGLSLRAPTPTQFCARGDARRKRSLRCGHITSCTYPHSGHFIEVRGLLTRKFTTQRPKTPTVWTRHKLGRGPWLVICTQESARTRIFACGRITNHTEPHARAFGAGGELEKRLRTARWRHERHTTKESEESGLRSRRREHYASFESTLLFRG